jgi:hypothetical protein
VIIKGYYVNLKVGLNCGIKQTELNVIGRLYYKEN